MGKRTQYLVELAYKHLPRNYAPLDDFVLEKEKKVLFFKGWVFVKNAKKDNNYTQSPKNQIAHDKEISLIPDEVRAYFDSSINSSIDSTIDTVSIVPINHKPEIINNKTETKERKKFSSIEDITAEVIAELAEKYKVRYQFAELNFEKMSNWLESSGKIKKNYKATLANFIIGDEKFEQEQKTYRSLHSTQNQTVNTTEKYELSPIEREKAQKRLDEIRSKFHTKGFDS